jgi:iron complex outermembrane recepter protein
VEFDAQLRSVDRLAGVPAYVTLDLRLAYRPTDRLEVSIAGLNLLEGQHREQAPIVGALISEVPRSFHAKLTWRF